MKYPKCPKCSNELGLALVPDLKTGSVDVQYACTECNKAYTDKELQDFEDAEKIEEDTEIWKEAKEIQRRMK